VNPAAEVKDLVRRFGSFVAVDGISFRVEQGEVFGFLGPNGAGKTTTLKVLLGILAPTSGAVRVAGLAVPRDIDRVRPLVGYMSQRFSLYEELDPRENLEFFGAVYGLGREALAEAVQASLKRFELDRAERRPARDLPSGARQRLALACALVHDPRVIVLDEPTSGMDPSSRRRFWESIHSLAAAGRTIIVTTHYLDEAEYCNRLCLISRGRIIAAGTPDQVRALSRRIALTITCAPVARGLAALLSRPELGETAIYGDGLRLVTADPAAARAAVPALLARAGVRQESIVEDAPTLEDVFVQLVRDQDD
jgi:ABC-2 type transport system ATP-binding protein